MRKYTLSLIALSLIISCSKRVITSSHNNIYVPYSEILHIKKINLTNSRLRAIISDFVNELTIFENGVNSFSSYPVDYFISAESLCKNDSSLIVLRASAGSYFFYGHANDLDERILDQFRFTEVDKRNVIIAKDIEDSLCTNKKLGISKDSVNKGEFVLKWFKKSNGDRLIDFYPYFFRIYNVTGEEIESIELVFPDRIQKLK